jgi:hypothetical protein
LVAGLTTLQVPLLVAAEIRPRRRVRIVVTSGANSELGGFAQLLLVAFGAVRRRAWSEALHSHSASSAGPGDLAR